MAKSGRFRASFLSMERLLAVAMAATLAVSSAAAQAPPAAPPVTVAKPLLQEITDWREYTGQFTAIESVEIRARVSGYLTEIHFEDGQFVKKGDLLFVIDPRPFEIARDTAKAQVAQATAKLELGNRQLARAAELRQRDNIPASTYDERVQEVQDAKASLDAGHAAVASAELDLEFCHITAPMAGHVSRHLVSLGNLVFGGTGGNTTLLTTIVATDPIYLTFDISEADLLAYRRAAETGELKAEDGGGLVVQGRLIDENAWTLKGSLNFVENQVDRGSGTLRVRAVFPNPDARILAGQFGRVRLPASAPHQAMLVPDAAILSDQSQKLVMVVGADGTVEPRRVTLGTLLDTLRVVEDGIKPDDRVIINGLLRAHPGAKVTPQDGKIEMSKLTE